MNTELTTTSTSLASVEQKMHFSDDQLRMIRDTYANGASESEFQMLMAIAKARKLNPLFRQIWFVNRWDSQKNKLVWSPQVSIDGLRCIAERSGLYDGQDEPEFIYEEGHKTPSCVKVRIYKKGIPRPFVGVAHFSEYVAKKKDGKPTQMWSEKPHIMISKCAEALALRKAFPEDMAGLYVPEEMDQAQRHEEEPPRPSMAARAIQAHRTPEDTYEMDSSTDPSSIAYVPPAEDPRIKYTELLVKLPLEHRTIVEKGMLKKGFSVASYAAALKYMTDTLNSQTTATTEEIL